MLNYISPASISRHRPGPAELSPAEHILSSFPKKTALRGSSEGCSAQTGRTQGTPALFSRTVRRRQLSRHRDISLIPAGAQPPNTFTKAGASSGGFHPGPALCTQRVSPLLTQSAFPTLCHGSRHILCPSCMVLQRNFNSNTSKCVSLFSNKKRYFSELCLCSI